MLSQTDPAERMDTGSRSRASHSKLTTRTYHRTGDARTKVPGIFGSGWVASASTNQDEDQAGVVAEGQFEEGGVVCT